jgi:hypothetical protein
MTPWYRRPAGLALILVPLLLLGVLGYRLAGWGADIPSPPSGSVITVAEAHVGTPYAFGLAALGLGEGEHATVERVEVTGLGPAATARVEAAETTSNGPLRALVGAPQFTTLPVKGLEVRGRGSSEDHYLLVVITPRKTGIVTTTGVDVTFKAGLRSITRHYDYRFSLEVPHARGTDPRARGRSNP